MLYCSDSGKVRTLVLWDDWVTFHQQTAPFNLMAHRDGKIASYGIQKERKVWKCIYVTFFSGTTNKERNDQIIIRPIGYLFFESPSKLWISVVQIRTLVVQVDSHEDDFGAMFADIISCQFIFNLIPLKYDILTLASSANTIYWKQNISSVFVF